MRTHIPVMMAAVCLTLCAACVMTACKTTDVTAANRPAEPAISEQTAIQTAAGLIEGVFSVTVDTDQMQVADLNEDWCKVYVNHTENGGYDYYASVDTQTGQIMYVERNGDNVLLTDEQREKAAAFNLLTAPESDIQDLIADCTPIAQALVERVFADGRTITKMQFASIMSDGEINATQQVSISVRMSEGTCYAVAVAWPQMEMLSVTAFPLGWESCYYGYQDPAEADEYPPLED